MGKAKKVGNHRPDYYQLMGGVELYADVTSASQAGGRHITSKLEGVKFKRPVCAADIVYDDNAMEDCLNYYNSGNKLTTTDKSLLDIKKVLMKFSLNLYELKVEELEPEELNLEKFGSKESILQVIIENKQGLSLKEICNRHEFGFYKTPIEMVSDIQRVFSSWNVLINKSPSPLSLIMIIVMKHVMGVINSHIEKILNAPTWQQRIQILQSRLASI